MNFQLCKGLGASNTRCSRVTCIYTLIIPWFSLQRGDNDTGSPLTSLVEILCPGVTGVENLEKHSCKCKSWAMWAFSTLPAICGEKDFLNYVNQRGRVGTRLCLYSCSPAPAPQSFMAWRYLRICWERVF